MTKQITKQVGFFAMLMFAVGMLPAMASGQTMQDFAYGYKVDFVEGMSLYEFDIPEQIYKSVTRPDLGDIRVLNLEGDIVSHKVFSERQTKQAQAIERSQELSIFPLYKRAGESPELRDIHITTTDSGTIVNVGKPDVTDNTQESKEVLQGYLMDATELEHPIEKIQVVTGHEKNVQYYHSVTIEGSNDLKQWFTVDRGSVLAKLDHKGEQLTKDTIYFSKKDFKYYRLIWKQDTAPLPIATITAHFNTTGPLQRPALTWISAPGKAIGDEEKVFEYALPGYFPVSAVDVGLTQANSFGKIVLEARNDQSHSWKKQGAASVFSVIKDGDVLEEKEVHLSGNRYRFWKLTLLSEKEAFGSQPPSLKFGWAPETIRFLARGKSPFHVGFGNAQIDLLDTGSIGNKRLKSEIGHAQLSDYQVYGGISKLTRHQSKENPWKLWILWAVLILGVGGLIYMAIHLAKDIQKED